MKKCRVISKNWNLTEESIDHLLWYARQYHRQGKYRDAMNFALRVLDKNPENREANNIAIVSAMRSGKKKWAFIRSLKLWNDGILDPVNYRIFGVLAFQNKKPELALEVFKEYLRNLPRIKVLGKRKIREEIKDYMESCNAVIKKRKRKEHLKRLQEKLPVKQGAVNKNRMREKPDLMGYHSQVEVFSSFLPDFSGAKNFLDISYKTSGEALLNALHSRQRSDVETFNLALKGFQLSFRSSYDQLICLPTLTGVRSLWYQEETARKVMKGFRGRAILADEVGLGKTIEASMVMKEYILRGLVKSALILTPSSLVRQWQEELREKFGLNFVSSSDSLFRDDPKSFWEHPYILLSIHTAKNKYHFDTVTSRFYDMVIVDEAHHLKNRRTLNWKLVNSIKKSFLLMLTATPVQNKLEELYNLVTLLKPGQLKTLKSFKEEFVKRGDPTDPQNREKLRYLLREVMVRNTRSVARVHLPPRFATTVKVQPSAREKEFYDGISAVVSGAETEGGERRFRMALRSLLEAAGSSPYAALRFLVNLQAYSSNGFVKETRELLKIGKEIKVSSKEKQLIDLLRSNSHQKIIFVNYLNTLEHISEVLSMEHVPYVVFHGRLSRKQKEENIEKFRNGSQVLLASGSGGEGYNLQFCHFMINFDLPWNPMKIEQRIGRIHRIGQEKEVHVYNLCAEGSLEDHILEVLDKKINMFEMVVGEIDMILGRLRGEKEFGELVYEIWVKYSDEPERLKAFNSLGIRLKRARNAYEKSKDLDEKLFREDFGV